VFHGTVLIKKYRKKERNEEKENKSVEAQICLLGCTAV
jgi:hypothetical protein